MIKIKKKNVCERSGRGTRNKLQQWLVQILSDSNIAFECTLCCLIIETEMAKRGRERERKKARHSTMGKAILFIGLVSCSESKHLHQATWEFYSFVWLVGTFFSSILLSLSLSQLKRLRIPFQINSIRWLLFP